MLYSEEKLKRLADTVSERMGEKRFGHTVSVMKCARRLGEIYEISDITELCAAALLHDVAKEIPKDAQIEMLERCGKKTYYESEGADFLLHSFCAPIVIAEDFPEFATDNILSAVEKHTIGSSEMSTFDKIIFISDYVEETRPYTACKKVREFLFDGLESLDEEGKLKRLNDACIMSIDFTVGTLTRENRYIDGRIYETKNSLISKK